MLADSVSTLTNNAMKEVKAFLNTEVFGPGTPLPVIVEWVGAHVPDHGA